MGLVLSSKCRNPLFASKMHRNFQLTARLREYQASVASQQTSKLVTRTYKKINVPGHLQELDSITYENTLAFNNIAASCYSMMSLLASNTHFLLKQEQPLSISETLAWIIYKKEEKEK